MIYVMCVLMGHQVHGIRLETQGNQWLVYFKNTREYTQWVDSNRCLITNGLK